MSITIYVIIRIIIHEARPIMKSCTKYVVMLAVRQEADSFCLADDKFQQRPPAK